MTPRIPWLADLRAERFLQQRMRADAHAAFSARGWVDVPIPDGVYRALLGTHRFTRAALRITAGGTIGVVQQGTHTLLAGLCVYAGDWPKDDMDFVRSIPLADRVFTFWFLARVDPHALLRAANA